MWFAGFLAQLGSTAKRKTIYTGIVVGQLVTTLTGLIAGFALLANIVDVADAQIPNLALANKIFPAWIGVLFALIIFIAIFSSATPLLWTAVARFADERTNRYNILTAVLVVIGCVIAFLVPFNTLVNYIYVINGYAGFVLVLLMLIKDIRVAGARKAIKAQEKD